MDNINAYEKPVTLKNIVKFAVPTIAMTVFMSLVLVNKYVGLISLQYYQTIIAYIIDTMPIATVSNIAQ